MVSTYSPTTIGYTKEVAILVVVDVWFRHVPFDTNETLRCVAILVVVDVWFRRFQGSLYPATEKVAILVVVDVWFRLYGSA